MRGASWQGHGRDAIRRRAAGSSARTGRRPAPRIRSFRRSRRLARIPRRPRATVSLFLATLLVLLTRDAALPAPTGPSPVGTRVLFLVDHARSLPGKTELGRPVVVQLWYPAVAGSGSGPAPYALDPSLIELMVDAKYYGQTEERIRSWSTVDTHARLDAELADGAPLAVLLFSHGLGLSRA